jgi:hypothetical protein
MYGVFVGRIVRVEWAGRVTLEVEHCDDASLISQQVS